MSRSLLQRRPTKKTEGSFWWTWIQKPLQPEYFSEIDKKEPAQEIQLAEKPQIMKTPQGGSLQDPFFGDEVEAAPKEN